MPHIEADLSEKRQTLILTLILWQLGFLGLTFVIFIFLTHKIAGPLYKLTQYLSAFNRGENYGKLKFRGGDYFPELADEYNKAMEKIIGTYHHDAAFLSEANEYLGKLTENLSDGEKIKVEKIRDKLSLIQNRYLQD